MLTGSRIFPGPWGLYPLTLRRALVERVTLGPRALSDPRSRFGLCFFGEGEGTRWLHPGQSGKRRAGIALHPETVQAHSADHRRAHGTRRDAAIDRPWAEEEWVDERHAEGRGKLAQPQLTPPAKQQA